MTREYLGLSKLEMAYWRGFMDGLVRGYEIEDYKDYKPVMDAVIDLYFDNDPSEWNEVDQKLDLVKKP